MSPKNGPSYEVKGQIVDLSAGTISPGRLTVEAGRIAAREKISQAPEHFITPGFVDAHVHIESSMLVPAEFARLAVVHGTVATVSDPHEIANVLGVPGVDYMLANSQLQPFHFCFGAPSCVPATKFETAGAEIDSESVAELLSRPGIGYLSEMMNFPGVLGKDSEVLAKIEAAKRIGKPVDGHAPGLRGKAAAEYIAAGISTDHECFTYAEAREKIEFGMKIIIREGSAAKNFDALIPLLNEFPDRIMFCSDDKHPNELVAWHINDLVRRAVAAGIPAISALRAACLNPVRHYGLSTGLLNVGGSADFIVLNNLKDFKVLETHIRGQKVAQNGLSLLPHLEAASPNNFSACRLSVQDLEVKGVSDNIRVIEALDGQLITRELSIILPPVNGQQQSSPELDCLKLVVVNRYIQAKPALAFVRGFGFKHGAIASSVAHDSHNVIAVGVSDEDLCQAINLVMESSGGIAVSKGEEFQILPLPVAGLMTTADGYETARCYAELDSLAKSLGSKLSAPFMTLSFMALLVIPELKLSDLGLFDGRSFKYVSLGAD